MTILVPQKFDADRVFPRLWQGAIPPAGHALRRNNSTPPFDVLVLSAVEHQPEAKYFYGVEVIHCPLDDDGRGLSPEEVQRWRNTTEHVSRALRSGKRVLTTCFMGMNRSGLINAAVIMRSGFDCEQALAFVRQARGPMALSNRAFQVLLHQDQLRRMQHEGQRMRDDK